MDGKGFEREVHRLLKLQGWTVTPEQQLLHKKIDALAERLGDFGQREKFAVECKDYSSALSQNAVSTIYANYLPLIDERQVDAVLLVTREGLAPTAFAFVQNARGFIHTTLAGLLDSLIDFKSYTHGLICQFEADDVNMYYVKQSFDTSTPDYQKCTSAEDALLHWIHTSDDDRPVAILGGYGMGKTTLARRLACLLARDHQKDARSRLPIYLKLDDLGSEQSLEGLLGKQFTSVAVIRNYNFEIFMELNQRGRFAIFLDGFDEMKYTMSWEALRYNFQQLNRLVTPSSKVVLSGRPSAFLSEEEHVEILHGVRTIAGKDRKLPGAPDFHEFHLRPFTTDQIQSFIGRYIDRLRNEKGESVPRGTMNAASQIPADSPLFNLASRPVQLKMLLEILPTWEKHLDAITVSILYSEFLDLMVRRELDKHSRGQFGSDQRRQFARELAWWMWQNHMGGAVPGWKIPDSVFARFARENIDIAEVRRDLLSACSLDTKQPDGYYFAHRSFQEFLVSERLVEMCQAGSLPTDRDIAITPEILEFFQGLTGTREIRRFKSWLWSYRGTLPQWIIEIVITLFNAPEEILEDREAMDSPWSYALIVDGLLRGKWSFNAQPVVNFLSTLLGTPPQGRPERDQWARLLILLNVLVSDDVRKVGCEENGRMLDLLNLIGTARDFFGRRKVPARDLVSTQETSHFCFVNRWQAVLETSAKWYSFGRRDPEGELDRTKEHANKLPHKRKGVTKKRHFKHPF